MVYPYFKREKAMQNLQEYKTQTTKEYFERTGAGLVREFSGNSGIVNKSKDGKILILSHNANTVFAQRLWNYDSVDSMLADGWVLE